MALSPAELRRYGRHLSLPEVGLAGQEAFRAARVALVGVGGLGAPAALYLAAAGVGTLGLIDHDQVDETNLQRQILFRQADLGRPKLAAAADTLREQNPHVTLELHETWLSSNNALAILGGYDVVVNGSDNFPTRYLVNDACALLGKPLVDGSIYRFEGQVTVYDVAAGGPCYRCRFPAPPPPGLVPNCAEAGVLGVLPGLVGSLQAAEALKLLLRAAGKEGLAPLVGRLLMIDVLAMEFLEFATPRDPACPLCGEHRSIHHLVDYEAFCAAHATTQESAVGPAPNREISAPDLAERLAAEPDLLLLDVREAWEWELCRIAGAQLMPLSEFAARLPDLPPDRPIVTYCHAGVRSLKALDQLRAAGYTAVQSLAGGIDAWSRLVDPAVSRY